jgi:hypothetical protein
MTKDDVPSIDGQLRQLSGTIDRASRDILGPDLFVPRRSQRRTAVTATAAAAIVVGLSVGSVATTDEPAARVSTSAPIDRSPAEPPTVTDTPACDNDTCGLVEQVESDYAADRHPVPGSDGQTIGWISNQAFDRSEPASSLAELDPVYNEANEIIAYWDFELGPLDKAAVETGTLDLAAERERHDAENPKLTREQLTESLRQHGYTEEEINEV